MVLSPKQPSALYSILFNIKKLSILSILSQSFNLIFSDQIRQAKMLIEEMNGDSKNLFKVLFGAGQVGAVLSDEFIQVSCLFTGNVK
jgi:hypothetical protein